MSLGIWTQCAQKFSFIEYRGTPWRVVEAQHVISTRKLVDSDDEQQLLEELIDEVKPSLPYDEECRAYHYLLWTPFRYPPLQYGSRLGSYERRGIWYGSESLETAFAEKAYYTFLFRSGSKADFGVFEVPITAFCIPVLSTRGADLIQPPFKAFESQLMAPDSYQVSQEIGSGLRDISVETISFQSARCPARGMNLAVIQLTAFQQKIPDTSSTWFCVSSDTTVEFKAVGFQPAVRRAVFEKSDFERNGKFQVVF